MPEPVIFDHLPEPYLQVANKANKVNQIAPKKP